MKLLKKISIGAINGVRGGLKDIKGKVRVITIAGIATGYTEKVSETMGISYAFKGEFRAINRDGEEAAAAVAYLPEPAQAMLKTQLENIPQGSSVEFGFNFFAIEDATALKGYYFECEPLMDARPSTALESLTAKLGFDAASVPANYQLSLDAPKPEAVPQEMEAEPVKATGNHKKK